MSARSAHQSEDPADGQVHGGVLRSPWTFVPLLYFLQAVPVSLVQDVAALIYKDMGIGNEAITQWTSLAALPWALQFLLGPLVDVNSSKRRWVMACQAALTLGLVVLPWALHLPHAFEVSIVLLFLIAVASTLGNVATDGLYLLALAPDTQARFAGVQTTCYRLGTFFCKGILLIVAGRLEVAAGMPKLTAWSVALLFGAAVYGVGFLLDRQTIPQPLGDKIRNNPLETRRSIRLTIVILAGCLSAYFAASALVRLVAWTAWAWFDGTDVGRFHGWRLTDPGRFLGVSLGTSGAVAELIQLLVSVAVFTIAGRLVRQGVQGSEMGTAFGSYFRQPGIWAILFFLMFYRFGEAMVGKMAPLFLKDSIQAGGLALSTDQIGAIRGGVGVLGIVAGGLLGGYVVSNFGLRRSFWGIAILMHAPNLLYLWASRAHPPVAAMYGIDFCEQFGYGFGFAGYMIYQMTVARRGQFPTTHYALGVGIGALFISVAGVLSGVIQVNFGYPLFFTSVIFFSLPGLLSLRFIPLDDPDNQTLSRGIS